MGTFMGNKVTEACVWSLTSLADAATRQEFKELYLHAAKRLYGFDA
jgi:hypothetical protein